MSLLGRVDFDIYLTLPEFWEGGAAWPPERFRSRNERLRALEKLWYGDFSDHLTNQAVPVNSFQDYSTRLADLMLMSQPQGVDVVVDSALYDAVIDLSRYGGSVLYWDGELSAKDPLGWYPLHVENRGSGDVFFTKFISDSALSSIPDRAQIDMVDHQTQAVTRRVYAYTEGRLGNVLSEETLDEASVAVVPADPAMGIWGSSKYSRLCGPVIEIVRRLSKNSAVSDLYTGPKLIYRSTAADAIDRFPPSPEDPADIEEVIRGRLGEAFEGEIIRLDPDTCLVDAAFLQPDTSGVTHALSQVETLRMFIADSTGMPDPNTLSQAVSGVAIKLRHLPWYAETSRLQNRLREAVDGLLEVNLQWPHLFDTLGDVTPERVPPMRVQVSR